MDPTGRQFEARGDAESSSEISNAIQQFKQFSDDYCKLLDFIDKAALDGTIHHPKVNERIAAVTSKPIEDEILKGIDLALRSEQLGNFLERINKAWELIGIFRLIDIEVKHWIPIFQTMLISLCITLVYHLQAAGELAQMPRSYTNHLRKLVDYMDQFLDNMVSKDELDE